MRTYAFLASLFASGALGQNAVAATLSRIKWVLLRETLGKSPGTAAETRSLAVNAMFSTRALARLPNVSSATPALVPVKAFRPDVAVARAPLAGSPSLAEYEKTFRGDRGIVISKTITDNIKRQTGDWINLVTYDGVIKPGERWRVNTEELAPDIDRTWEESSFHSITVGVTASVSAGLFEIFTASMEISTSYEETYSVASSLKYSNGDCPSGANIYYAPVYTRYGGI
ncbi:Ff.00g065480.m01.CDS01 [Fusarium sp. VM40]|nr:Ff.00g065480.m01.CDS01 [Fusarium sp. VM40]